jgi:hypothetical protein
VVRIMADNELTEVEFKLVLCLTRTLKLVKTIHGNVLCFTRSLKAAG